MADRYWIYSLTNEQHSNTFLYKKMVLGHFADKHFADRHFADKPDISPTGHFADRQFADRDYFDIDSIKTHIFMLAMSFF